MYEQIVYRYVQPSYATSIITREQVENLVLYTAKALSQDEEGTIQMIKTGKVTFLDASLPGSLCFYI